MNTAKLSSDQETDFDFSNFLDLLIKNFWSVLATFFAVVSAGVAYTILATPIYKADALIQVEDKKAAPIPGMQDIADALGTGVSSVTGEIEILKSREVILSAIKETKADIFIENKNRFPILGNWFARRQEGREGPIKPFLGLSMYSWGGDRLRIDQFSVPPAAYGQEFIIRVRDTQNFELFNAEAELLGVGKVGQQMSFSVTGGDAKLYIADMVATAGTEYGVMQVDPVTAYRTVLADLTVAESGKQSSIIRISYLHPDISFAQKLVNAIASAYLKQNVERRSAEANQSLQFLEQQLPEIKRNVEVSENALNNFRTRTNTVSVEKSIDALLGQAVNVERSRLELQLKRDEMAQRYRPDHPMLRAIEAQLAATTLEARKISDQVNNLPQAQRDLLRLQRDAEVNNQLYVALLNNAQQLRLAKAGTIGNVRVIDFAVQDRTPVAPKKLQIIAGCAVLGLVLGVAVAYLLRVLRPTIGDVSEIERATGLVAYANIPESNLQHKLNSALRDKKGKAAIIVGQTQLLAELSPDDPAIESLRSFRTGLAFAMMGAPNNAVVITGPTASLGKSFVSANLSVLLAAAGKKVLLVETDLRRPQLGAYFGYKEANGLSDILVGKVEPEDAVKRVPLSTGEVYVLPSGQIPPNPGELLLSAAFEELIANFTKEYEYVLLDSAPVLPVGDTLAVARTAGAVFMVARAEQTTITEITDALKKLDASGISVKGVIFNGIKRWRVKYGYAYKYYYGYGQNG